MKAAPRIFNQRSCERNYYEMAEPEFSPVWESDPSSYLDPVSRVISDMVTVDIHQQDLAYLLELDRLHRTRCRNPSVQAAWEQYQMLLRLAGEHV